MSKDPCTDPSFSFTVECSSLLSSGMITSSASAASWQVCRVVQMVTMKILLDFLHILAAEHCIIQIRCHLLHCSVKSRGGC
jgi:hypothetical protein